jgi:hypothetical protein
MYRAIAVVGIAIGLGLVSVAAPKPAPTPSLSQKLNQRVKFDGIEDARTTLGDALDKLAKLGDVAFDVDESAFKAENVVEVLKTEIATTPIPAMKNVRFSTVLHKVLSRIPTATAGATFLVRGDSIEITTVAFQNVAVWGGTNVPRLPLVNLVLEKTPLEDAVKELAELSDFNIVVDNRVADKMKVPVSAKFLNTPLDTALRFLTDMADLRTVHLDNVLYVTTKENAAVLEERLEKEKGPATEENNPEGLQGTPGYRKGTGRVRTPPLPQAGA